MKSLFWKFSIGLYILVTVLSTLYVGDVRLNHLQDYDTLWIANRGSEEGAILLIFFGSVYSTAFMFMSPHLGIPVASCTASIVGLSIARDVFSGINPIGTVALCGGVFFVFSAIVALDKLGWILFGSIPFVFQAAVIGFTASMVHTWLPLAVYLMLCTAFIWLFFFGLRWEPNKTPT